MASDLGRSASEIKEKWFTSHQDGRMEESVTTRIGSSGSIRNEIVDRKLSNSDVDILSDAIDHGNSYCYSFSHSSPLKLNF